MEKDIDTPPIHVRSLYAQTYAKHGKTASQSKAAQELAYRAVEKKHGSEMRKKLSDYHARNQNESVEIDESPELFQRSTRAQKAKLQHLKALDKTVDYQKERLEKAREERKKRQEAFRKEEVEQKDEREYDYEGDMVKTQLKTIIRNAENMHDMLEDDDNLPEWVELKITLAADYIVTAANYLESEMTEEVKEVDEYLEEKSVPTSPEKWARAKAMAKSKFDVYPSAYANGWAAKKYKEMGGNWKTVNEAKEKPPFEGPYTKTKGTVIDKSGAKHTPMSRVKNIAQMAMKKQLKIKKKMPVKEEMRKIAIVKEIMKKKKAPEDTFHKDPELSTTLSKV
jgi:hypothetical protein